MILNKDEIKETALWWLSVTHKPVFFIYWLVMALFAAGFLSLFFIQVDLSVRAPGIVRPLSERTDLRSSVSGIIDSICVREGDRVLKNAVVVKLRNPTRETRFQLIETGITKCNGFLHDLDLLCNTNRISPSLMHVLNSSLYREEAERFISREAEQEVVLEKANHERLLNEQLAMEKVISPKEFYDIRMVQLKARRAFETLRREQLSSWQADLQKYTTELKQFLSERSILEQENETDQIRSPVDGMIQDISGHYPGNLIQAGETICSVSPEGQLTAECYVLSKDIGLIRKGQPVRFQIEALNYNYFGVAAGTVYAIDNDFSVMDKKSVFKVRCRLQEKMLKLSNGYIGEIKKGMNVQARFHTCSRSSWQLLYDGLDNWLNPATVKNN